VKLRMFFRAPVPRGGQLIPGDGQGERWVPSGRCVRLRSVARDNDGDPSG
jgi:hypothetical protein